MSMFQMILAQQVLSILNSLYGRTDPGLAKMIEQDIPAFSVEHSLVTGSMHIAVPLLYHITPSICQNRCRAVDEGARG